MINLHTAIFALNTSISTIRGDVAYDANEQEVAYDQAQAQAKLVELQEAEATAQAGKQATQDSATSKLKALGLTDDEISALKGTL
jgi:hypothetical protein